MGEESQPRVVTRARAELSQPRLGELDAYLTPNERFYVRDHFVRRPSIDPSTWRLSVAGLVDEPLELGLDELRAMPSREVTVTLECAGSGGHGRGALRAQTMMSSMVGNARWSGVPVAAVLERAGLHGEATELVFRGADGGTDPDEPVELDCYVRSIPRDKALDPDTLLAYEMNGQPLPPAHGHPLRLVVPGWYGMDSIKWLVSIEAVREPFRHFYMDHRYREDLTEEGLHAGRMIRPMQVKSVITWPGDAARLLPGRHTVRGWAWAGEHRVVEVLVSADGGGTWQPAVLDARDERYAWRGWSYELDASEPGPRVLVLRARDETGRVQPLTDGPVRTYEANWVHRVRVYVVSGLAPDAT